MCDKDQGPNTDDAVGGLLGGIRNRWPDTYNGGHFTTCFSELCVTGTNMAALNEPHTGYIAAGMLVLIMQSEMIAQNLMAFQVFFGLFFWF